MYLLNDFLQEQVLANLVVEEEPGGDERVGEDSQDESTGSTSAIPRLNPVAPDEDTLHSSLDENESSIPPELSASAFSVDSESSNSSADIPLLPRKEPAGTKRKAEVLSKESGKIGVTITTSSPSSGSTSPPPGKLPRLLPIKGNATSPTYNVSFNIKKRLFNYEQFTFNLCRNLLGNQTRKLSKDTAERLPRLICL